MWSLVFSFTFAVIFVHKSTTVDGQLAAVYSNVSRTNDCSTWSSWGQCIWPNAKTNKSYIGQLSAPCREHWFYKFIGSRYGHVLDEFFQYFRSVLKSRKACGMCSYRQSCGFGGSGKCNLSPFEVPGGRSVFPFYVAEKVCGQRDLKTRRGQNNACAVNYELLKQNTVGNGGNDVECQLWPTPKVNLSSIETNCLDKTKLELLTILRYSCVTQTKRSKNARGKKSYKVCRCCCFPFRPNPQTFVCEPIPGAPPAPGSTENF